MNRIGTVLTALALLVSLQTGCKTKPAPSTGYLPDSVPMTEQRARFPFQRVWVKPGVDKDDYDRIVIGSVNTSYLMENTGWKAANPGNTELDEAVEELAQYMQETFDRAFRDDPQHKFLMANQRGPHTLILQLAITEVVPAKAALGALGLVAPVVGQTAVGIGSKAAAGKPSIAIEGRVLDGQTGEVLFMFADREERQWRPIDLKAMSWWGHAKPIIDDWARQCVELANTPSTYQVEDRSAFTLKPW
jgi:hypothetical protein